MLDQSVVFDIPQARPSVVHTFHRDAVCQDVGEYDNLQIRVVPQKARLATGVNSDDRGLSYVYDHPQPKKDFAAQLRILHQQYTILSDDRTMIELLEAEPALYSLLIEAVEPLRQAFGDKRLIYIRVLSSDEDSILKVTVRLLANFGDNPEDALQAFDEEWWLKNCHRSGGTLVFDYEMPDAIRLA
jgi:hypothetical protein